MNKVNKRFDLIARVEELEKAVKALSKNYVRAKDFVLIVDQVMTMRSIIEELKRAFPHIRFGENNGDSRP